MAPSLLDISDSPLPKTLFKYMPPDRIDLLESLELRFSRPSEFNYAFDTHYLVPKVQGVKGISARSRLRSRLGVLCLTERPDNHLMWVHYARHHTGFVIGFDAEAAFFRADDRVLGKVQYQPGPNVLSDADAKACFYKSNAWSYEQEWRCIREFGLSEPRGVTFEPSLVTQIILGSQMEPWHITRIVRYVTAYEMNHVQFCLSAPSNKSWIIQNSPKAICLCGSCGGDGYLMNDAPRQVGRED